MDWKSFPKKLDIFGVTFKVAYVKKVVDDDGSSLCGLTLIDSRSIKISKTENENHDQVYRTLYHEAFHAALHVSGQAQNMVGEQEESVVIALENCILPLIRQIGVPNV